MFYLGWLDGSPLHVKRAKRCAFAVSSRRRRGGKRKRGNRERSTFSRVPPETPTRSFQISFRRATKRRSHDAREKPADTHWVPRTLTSRCGATSAATGRRSRPRVPVTGTCPSRSPFAFLSARRGRSGIYRFSRGCSRCHGTQLSSRISRTARRRPRRR